MHPVDLVLGHRTIAALRQRLRWLEDPFASIGVDHSGIVARLTGMVGEALCTLGLAQRLAELCPTGSIVSR